MRVPDTGDVATEQIWLEKAKSREAESENRHNFGAPACPCLTPALTLTGMAEGYSTPEDAARGDIPERYARTVAVEVSPDGCAAIVLQLTNEPPAVEPYQTVCTREDGLWQSGSGGNGSGWGQAHHADTEVSYLTDWGEVPEGVVGVVLRWRDKEYRVPVSERYYLFVRWGESLENVVEYSADVVGHVHSSGVVEEIEIAPWRMAARVRSRDWLLERLTAPDSLPSIGLGEGYHRIALHEGDGSSSSEGEP